AGFAGFFNFFTSKQKNDRLPPVFHYCLYYFAAFPSAVGGFVQRFKPAVARQGDRLGLFVRPLK
ncbi:MAG: hypothetical protein K1X79_14105, partial [Oligoflexia bacterium]|nr:hypothetical protein [Oligoflexia bacterium]